MHNIYIISDSHFNHPAIVDVFEFRKKDYWRQICRKVKNNVPETSTLIHLWDVIFYKHWELEDYLKRMGNCKKILIKWNHDKKSNSFYYSKWFNLVCDEIKIGDVVFTHIPKWTLLKNEINVHGHLHNNHRHINEYTNDPSRYILYDAMSENFMPRRLDKLIKEHEKKIKSMVNKT